MLSPNNMFGFLFQTYLWNISCSEERWILSTSSGSTFSFSLSSSCCEVSMQYSAVQSREHTRHCSSSVNLVTSPSAVSFRMLWISPVAVVIESCLDILQIRNQALPSGSSCNVIPNMRPLKNDMQDDLLNDQKLHIIATLL